MRVIAGEARRLILKTLPGNDTRPTTDMIKETLFNMINFDIPGSRFLDLYAGSGAIGIEALSRGAVSAAFVDNNPKATAVISENLEHTHFTDRAQVITSEAVLSLRRLSGHYDIVFMDPPYDNGLEDGVLRALAVSGLIDESTLLIVEMSIGADTEHFIGLGYDIEKIKSYKSNKHVFLRRTKA